MAFTNSKKAKLFYENDETVLCFHGPLLYEAKILKGEIWDGPEGETGPHYYVHYKGWKVKWDEWVSESRIMKFNEMNLQKKKELQEKHRSKDQAQKKEAAANAAASELPTKKGPNLRKQLLFQKIKLILI